MGRGLSELQRTILRIALDKPGRSVINGQVVGTDVHQKHIHRAYYGDSPRTNATRAAVSRAMVRLSERGLITLTCAVYSNWSGGDLTKAGEAAARELSVNEKEIFPQS